jgi:hypothetical protein
LHGSKILPLCSLPTVCVPISSTVDQAHRHEVISADEVLDFGIGATFVEDPDGDTVEFLQRDRGISAEILGSAS